MLAMRPGVMTLAMNAKLNSADQQLALKHKQETSVIRKTAQCMSINQYLEKQLHEMEAVKKTGKHKLNFIVIY